MSPKHVLVGGGVEGEGALVVIRQDNPQVSYLTALIESVGGQTAEVVSHFDFVPAESLLAVLAGMGIELGQVADEKPVVKVDYGWG